MKTFSNIVTFVILGICLGFMFSSCGTSEVAQNLSAQDRFNLAKSRFDQGDYLEAMSNLEIIKLQFPGSSVADTAQYYIGECHYLQEEYVLASEDYQALQRNYRSSALVPDALYKLAMCYYSLSPKSSLDQNYTSKAIDAFQNFIEYNPTNARVKDAEEKIKELNTKLAKKLYDSALLYMKLELFKSAVYYFSAVVEKYHDTPYAEPAMLGKAKALISRKKYDEATQEIQKFLEKYPHSVMTEEAIALQKRIQESRKQGASALLPVLH